MNRKKLIQQIKKLCPWGITPLDRTCPFQKCEKQCEKIDQEIKQ